MEGRESFTLDLIEDDLNKSGSSIEKEQIPLKGLNSVKDIVIDSVSAKETISTKKLDISYSITTLTSDLVSMENPVSVKDSKAQHSQSKSKTSVVNVSLTQSVNNVSNTHVSKELSHKSRLEKDITHEITEPSSNYISQQKSASRVSFQKTQNDTTKHDEVKKELDPTYSSSSVKKHYIPPWAKASSSTSIPSQPQLSRKDENTQEDLNLKCIPPWAKTMRKIYGMTCSDPKEEESKISLQEKIKGLMDKHSRLMLVKRGESRKQLILEPKKSGEMGTVKMTSKNTRYYMTPLPRTTENAFVGGDQTSTSLGTQMSVHHIKENDEISVTKKTLRSQAKTEVSHVLKSLYNSKRPQGEMSKDRPKINQFKCPKITPSKIRDYVNAQTLDPDEIKLHEIIKIKKVPSLGTPDGRKPSSKYTINVPKCSKGDGATVNKITVKEKHKLRLHSVEDINENITEIIYNKGDSKKQEKSKTHYYTKEHVEHDVVPFSNRRKSPTKSTTLKVSAESTPVITELLKKEESDRDKILLIQYEKKSKPCEGKSEAKKPTLISTQLFGVKQTCSKTLKEMYLYGTETDGNTTKENATKVDDVSPTLREKVNMIFQELREMTFKPCAEPEAENKLHSSISSKSFQYPPALVETDAVSVQALPDVRSAEVQVHDSVFFSQSQLQLIVPNSTPTSLYRSEEDGRESTDKLHDKTADITETSIRETESKTRSQVKIDQPTNIKEGDEEMLKIDDTESLQLDQEETSQERKHSLDDITKEEKTQHLEKAEDKDHISETVISDTEPTTGNQEEIVSGDQLTEEGDQLTEEFSEKEKRETLIEEDDFKPEEKGLKTMEDDTYLKEDEDFAEEMEKDEIEETSGKYSIEEIEKIDEVRSVKKDLKEEGGEKVYEMTDEPKETFNTSKEKINIFEDDIRSYDFDTSQESVRMVTSSKFVHQKDSIKRLNWTDDILYLEKNTCPQLVKGLAEIAVRQPADPISFLAHWIYKDYHNRESEELKSVHKEHMEVAKSMLSTGRDEKLIPKRFSIRRYPIKSYSSITSTKSVSSHAIEEIDTEGLKIEG